MEPQDYKEEEIPKKIAASDLQAYEFLFRQRYEGLYAYSAKITAEPQISEEIVQDVFVGLWEKREKLTAVNSISNYLYRAVKNKSIDYLRSKYAKIQKDFTSVKAAENKSFSPAEDLESRDLEAIIQLGIEKLPARCRQVFKLSREAELTYDEIAKVLAISPKTVKAQMGIALKKLKVVLDKHWNEFIILIINALHFFIHFL